MSLPLPILQSLVARTRNELGNLNELVWIMKGQRGWMRENSFESDVASLTTEIAKDKRVIAKLEIVQRALKRELASQITTNRDLRYMANLRSNLAARLEKAKTEAMDRAGEVF